jgi:acyl-homoserine lactone acylase PvdQ
MRESSLKSPPLRRLAAFLLLAALPPLAPQVAAQVPLAPIGGGPAAAAAAGPGPPPLVPAGTVKITYDDWGFPHIEAISGGTDHSVAWGAGYVQARDFPVTTAYNLAYSSGSIASILGFPWVLRDLQTRHWRLPEQANHIYTNVLTTDERNMLQAFVDGINADFRPWR